MFQPLTDEQLCRGLTEASLLVRDFQISLDFGSEYGTTAALAEGNVLVESRMPMRDACRLLLASGADPLDFVTFTRDGRLIGKYRMEGPTKWPDAPTYKDPTTRRVFTFDHSRRSPAPRAGGSQHHRNGVIDPA